MNRQWVRTFVLLTVVSLVVFSAACAQGVPAASSESSDMPVMIYFHTDDCQACDQMAPIVRALETEYDEQINVRYVNVSEVGAESYEKYSLRGYPSYVFLEADDDVRFQVSGRVRREVLENLIIRMVEE